MTGSAGAGRSTARLERARLDIARLGLGDQEELARALARAARTSAMALEVERVGVWLYDPPRTRIQCVELHERGRDVSGPGEALELARFPAYRAALEERRVVRADDARADPQTCELGEYLGRHGIGAMLDAPIFRRGAVVGVVCHEHVGPPRAWTQRDVDFATSVADMLSSLFEQAARLEAEARAARAERFQALGRLAASVAHDVNNILSAIGLAAQDLLLAPAPTPADVRQAAQDVVEQCERGGRLAGQLLAFGRAPPATPGDVDVTALIRETTAALAGLLQGRCAVAVEVDAAAGPLVVRADRTRLEQVLMNLVLNARDAIPEGRRGQVVVRARPDVDADGRRQVVLEVKDDGEGMDEATRARLFEPFFTTKRHGTGLGLATVYQAVDAAGGTVTVDSAPGAGATFSVRLPRAG